MPIEIKATAKLNGQVGRRPGRDDVQLMLEDGVSDQLAERGDMDQRELLRVVGESSWRSCDRSNSLIAIDPDDGTRRSRGIRRG